ncbi:MAG: M50 family metallopeptidase [Chloroflexota bacterium]|nr:M50 family metallopeptidase [Chloroflexota bacterium]
MSTPWAIFAFIVILAFLIFIHEIGHFVTAKWRGVKVLEFGIGYPPRIWAYRRGETEYSLNWLPIGGFCKMLGEEDPSETGSLASKGALTRLLVLSAGSLMMFIFPVILFSIIYMVPHDVIVGGEGIEVPYVNEGTPADLAGVEPGDQILSINGTAMMTFDDLGQIVDENLGEEITVIVLREGAEIEMNIVPREEWPADQGPLGIGIRYINVLKESERYPFWEAIPLGFGETWRMVAALGDGLSMIFAGEADFTPAGVIGMGQVTSEIAKDGGLLVLMGWAGFLSINLGIINLLPLPALDGGRITFVILEVVRRGKRVSARTEGMVHLVGFVLLIGLTFIIGYYDVLRVVRGESLLP